MESTDASSYMDFWPSSSTWESSGFQIWKIIGRHLPFFSWVMACDRFENIIWMLHVSHSTGLVVKKIDKVQMFLDKNLGKFQAKYTPGQELAVDETMVKFRGRFGGKQNRQSGA